MRALITGFGPFPGFPVNPSAGIIEAIDDGRLKLPPGIETKTAVLDTSWSKVAPAFSALLEIFDPDFALHFGVSGTVRGFRIEQTAHNTVHCQPDVDGDLPEFECIAADGPEKLKTAFNTKRLTAALIRKNIPATVSRDAGSYLCNMLYYLSLRRIKSGESLESALFVHIPPESAFARRIDLFTGVQIILRTCMTDRICRKDEAATVQNAIR